MIKKLEGIGTGFSQGGFVCTWNELQEEVVEEGTIPTFKRHLDNTWMGKVWRHPGYVQASWISTV